MNSMLGLAIFCFYLCAPNPTQGAVSCTQSTLDLQLIVDSSGSVGEQHFNQMMKDIAEKVIASFVIGPTNTRVALFKYASSMVNEFDLDKFLDMKSLKKATKAVKFIGGGTNTGRAMEEALGTFTKKMRKDPNAAKVCIVFTDGKAGDASIIPDVRKKWTDAGVTIFAVGIGAGISKEGLVAIAGNENQALQVKAFSKLATFTNTLLKKVCPTVNGGFGSWGSWSPCSLSCGGGTQSRSRKCNNPTPANGGGNCVGSSTGSLSCNTGGCPVNGGFGSWGSWSSCSLSCGGGTQSRLRKCNNPTPANGGRNCVGSSTGSLSCNTGGCPGIRCSTKYTAWNKESRIHRSLDKLDVNCGGANKALASFRLRRDCDGIGNCKGRFRYMYSCCTVPKLCAIESKANCWLDNHHSMYELAHLDVDCDGQPLNQFRLYTTHSKSSYRFRCLGCHAQRSSCHAHHTAFTVGSPLHPTIFLDRQNVKCPPNEFMTRFKLSTNQDKKIRYDYTCCRYLSAK